MPAKLHRDEEKMHKLIKIRGEDTAVCGRSESVHLSNTFMSERCLPIHTSHFSNTCSEVQAMAGIALGKGYVPSLSRCLPN